MDLYVLIFVIVKDLCMFYANFEHYSDVTMEIYTNECQLLI